MRPRRKQEPITIRSDRAAARLRMLTSDGRSQAEVVEEALDKMPLPVSEHDELQRWMNRVHTLVAEIPKSSAISIEEFDVLEYDETGLPR